MDITLQRTCNGIRAEMAKISPRHAEDFTQQVDACIDLIGEIDYIILGQIRNVVRVTVYEAEENSLISVRQ